MVLDASVMSCTSLSKSPVRPKGRLVASEVSHDSLPVVAQCIQTTYMGKAAACTEQNMKLQSFCAVRKVGLCSSAELHDS